MAKAGGGVVEGYPHDTDGNEVSVLYNGTRALSRASRLQLLRPKGMRNCVMRIVMP